jgi:tRNA threonylcarbamoyl adenosine modification protein YjeE
MEKLVKTLTELGDEAALFAQELVPKKDTATLITLSGELGAGKTAFVKMIAKEMGIEETVNSPTFVLEKIYLLPGQKFKRLIHIDAYRLERGDNLSSIGFDEIIKDAQNIIFLEWPEKVTSTTLKPDKNISFQVLPDNSRIISYD